MLFTLGKIFFPTMLHREKELRARMRIIAIVFGVLLVGGVVAVISYVNHSRPQVGQALQPIKTK